MSLDAEKHERISELFSAYCRGRISRRDFVRGTAAIGGLTALQALLAACAAPSPAPAPRRPRHPCRADHGANRQADDGTRRRTDHSDERRADHGVERRADPGPARRDAAHRDPGDLKTTAANSGVCRRPGRPDD